VTALELEALDDASPRASSFVEVPIDRATDAATLPSDASSFIARGRTRGGSVVALGVLAVRDGRAHGPLFRVGTACALRSVAGARASFPRLLSPAIATSSRFVVLAGGADGDGAARSDAIVIDGERGVATRLGLRRRRVGAAVAIVDGLAVVAGGAAGTELWEDAELVALDRSEVLADPVRLAERRADAAAVALPTREVLLVGGRGPSGGLRTMEVIDPSKPNARTIDLASLSRPRRAPIALRLTTGELLVVGGVDDDGAPINDVEIFDASASKRLAVLPFIALRDVSAVALPSGAALVVTNDATTASAALIRADAIESLPTPPGGRLVPATDGAPFLYDGTFHRFEPFAGTFASVATPANFSADKTLAPFGFADGVLGLARSEGDELVIRALRYDARPPLVVDAATLGLGSTAHLSPDRGGVTVLREGLVMPPRARVAVTDATYLGMSMRLLATGRDRPGIELRAEDGAVVALITEASACSWPAADENASEIIRERNGELILRVGAAERRCGNVGTARVMLTLVADAAGARVRGLTVSRR